MPWRRCAGRSPGRAPCWTPQPLLPPARRPRSPSTARLDRHAAGRGSPRSPARSDSATRPGRVRPGRCCGSGSRYELLIQIARRIAAAGGVNRLAVHCRTRTTLTDCIVALVLAQPRRAEALGYGVAAVLDQVPADPYAVIAAISDAGAALARTPSGPPAYMLRPTIPVVAITGTNGKTTTARMIGYIAQRRKPRAVRRPAG